MADRQGIEIDFCPNCRGLWLDRGELDKIIDRAAVEAPYRVEGRGYERERREEHGYRHERRDEHGHRHGRRRREGFLGELFDFD
jgi:hypothetical protein